MFPSEVIDFFTYSKERWLVWDEMSALDLILCTICALLIWLLWQKLEKVKSEEKRRNLRKSKSQRKVFGGI